MLLLFAVIEPLCKLTVSVPPLIILLPIAGSPPDNDDVVKVKVTVPPWILLLDIVGLNIEPVFNVGIDERILPLPFIYPYVPFVTNVLVLAAFVKILLEPDITIEPVKFAAVGPVPPIITFDCDIGDEPVILNWTDPLLFASLCILIKPPLTVLPINEPDKVVLPNIKLPVICCVSVIEPVVIKPILSVTTEPVTTATPLTNNSPWTWTEPDNICLSLNSSPNWFEPLEYITDAVSYTVVR